MCIRDRIGALYALAVSQISARLAHPAVQLALAAPVALIVSGDPDPRRWGACLLYTSRCV